MESIFNSTLPECLRNLNLDVNIPIHFDSLSPEVIDGFAYQLLEIAESRHDLVVPVLNYLVDLPLSSETFDNLYTLAETSIRTCEESDYPLLFQTILKCVVDDCGSNHRSIGFLLDQMDSLSEQSRALAVESMLEVLPTNWKATQLFLQGLEEECHVLTTTFSVAKLAVLLLCFQQTKTKTEVQRLTEQLILQDRFCLLPFEEIILRCRSNEVWARLVDALWELIQWTLEFLSNFELAEQFHNLNRIDENTISWHVWGSRGLKVDSVSFLHNQTSFYRLLWTMFEHLPFRQEATVTYLLNQCLEEGSAGELNAAGGGTVSTLKMRSQLDSLRRSKGFDIYSLSWEYDKKESDRDWTGFEEGTSLHRHYCDLCAFPELGKAVDSMRRNVNGPPRLTDDRKGDQDDINIMDNQKLSLWGKNLRKGRVAAEALAYLSEQNTGSLDSLCSKFLTAITNKVQSEMQLAQWSRDNEGASESLNVMSDDVLRGHLASMTVAATRISPHVENTVLILLQKLLLSGSTGRNEMLMKLLGISSRSKTSCSIELEFNHFLVPSESWSSLVIISIATFLLKALLPKADHTFPKILEWLVKRALVVMDSSIVSLLDGLWILWKHTHAIPEQTEANSPRLNWATGLRKHQIEVSQVLERAMEEILRSAPLVSSLLRVQKNASQEIIHGTLAELNLRESGGNSGYSCSSFRVLWNVSLLSQRMIVELYEQGFHGSDKLLVNLEHLLRLCQKTSAAGVCGSQGVSTIQVLFTKWNHEDDTSPECDDEREDNDCVRSLHPFFGQWLGNADEAFVGPLKSYPSATVDSFFRLALERLLVAAIMIGHLQSEFVIQKEMRVRELGSSIPLVLIQLNNARYYLRASNFQCRAKCKARKESPKRVEKRRVVLLEKENGDKVNDVENEEMWHLQQLFDRYKQWMQGQLNRLENEIPIHLVMECLDKLIAGNQHDVPSSTESVNNSNNSNSFNGQVDLATNCGLALTVRLTRWVHASFLRKHSQEDFTGFRREQIWLLDCSEVEFQRGSFLIAKLGSFLPRLIIMMERARQDVDCDETESFHDENSRFSEVLGSVLSRTGLATLIVCLVTMLERLISLHPFVSTVGSVLAPFSLSFQQAASKAFSVRPTELEPISTDNLFSVILNSLKVCLEAVNDSTICQVILMCMIAISRVGSLDISVANISWKLFHSLHSEATDFMCDLTRDKNDIIPGLDSHWLVLARRTSSLNVVRNLLSMLGHDDKHPCKTAAQQLIQISHSIFCKFPKPNSLFRSTAHLMGQRKLATLSSSLWSYWFVWFMLGDQEHVLNGIGQLLFRSVDFLANDTNSTKTLSRAPNQRDRGCSSVISTSKQSPIRPTSLAPRTPEIASTGDHSGKKKRRITPVLVSSVELASSDRQSPFSRKGFSQEIEIQDVSEVESVEDNSSDSDYRSTGRGKRSRGKVMNKNKQNLSTPNQSVVLSATLRNAIGRIESKMNSSRRFEHSVAANHSVTAYPYLDSSLQSIQCHFLLGMSSLALLLAYFEPCGDLSQSPSSPYGCLEVACSLFIWALKTLEGFLRNSHEIEFQERIDTFMLQNIRNIVRLCNAWMPLTKTALESCIEWRTICDSRHGTSSNDESSDWKSLNSFNVAFHSIYNSNRAILEFAEFFEGQIESAESAKTPKSLSKTVSQLESRVADHLQGLKRAAEVHSLDLPSNKEMRWTEEDLRKRFEAFSSD